jgi:hypothetical protein
VLLCACFCLWQPSSITSECLCSRFFRGGIVFCIARRHVTFCLAPAQQLWLVHHGHLAGGSCSNWRSCANAAAAAAAADYKLMLCSQPCSCSSASMCMFLSVATQQHHQRVSQ